jgi:hypothetical protein
MDGVIPPSKLSKEESKQPGLQAPQILRPDEIEAFLNYIFSDISRRPKRLKLKETAAVARYLKAVAVETSFSPERELVERVAEVIWGTLLDTGQIEIASTEQVMEFLEEHAPTYLASFDVPAMVKYLRQVKAPTRHSDFFRPSNLMGKRRSGSHRGPDQLPDDLTERIYAAYHALRKAQVRDARGRVSEVLNRLGYKTQSRSDVNQWSSAEVIERCRQYEARLKQRYRLTNNEAGRMKLAQLREAGVAIWVSGFRFRLQFHGNKPIGTAIKRANPSGPGSLPP